MEICVNRRNLWTIALLLTFGWANSAAVADLRWGDSQLFAVYLDETLGGIGWSDSPAFLVNVRPIVNGLGWANSNTTSLDLTLVSRAFANSNSFSVDSPAPPPDQPAQGQNIPAVTINLDRLWVWDDAQNRFVDPPGPITINPSQPTYLLTHGWDDTLGPQQVDGCPAGDYEYAMSSIAGAIHEALPNANILGWQWGESGANPDGHPTLTATFWDLWALYPPPIGPGYLTLRVALAIGDAYAAGRNAGREGAALAKSLARILDDPNVATLGSAVHFIGHSHGGGLLVRAAQQLHDRGYPVSTVTMLDTPRWGIVDTMDLLEDPSKIGHVTIFYGDGDLLSGAFGAPYNGEPNNVTSIRVSPSHVHWPVHNGLRGDDHEFTCGQYASWFGDAVGGVTFEGGPAGATVLDPRTMPAGRFHEGSADHHFWPVGACNAPGVPCFETDQEDCTVTFGGTFQGPGTHCTTIYERVRDGTPPRPENDGLRLLWHNGMESAAGWQGTNAVVAAGSDPANPANVLVRIVDAGDASFFRPLAWPTDAYALTFDYMFDTQAVSETLTVYIGEQIVYYDAADISLARGGLRSTGPIAVRDFAGQTATLSFVLRTDSVPGGMCLIDNLRLLALPAGDVDFNGIIDQTDALKFMAVMNGPDIAAPPPGGSPNDFDGADFEEDYDVDLHDFALMQVAL